MDIDPRLIVRVFPRRTAATPDDGNAFVGDPPFEVPRGLEVHVSCCFTWDRPEAERLAIAWARTDVSVKIGGPAYGDPGGEFVPGKYLKPGYVITSRGCPNNCGFCMVPEREGKFRPIPIRDGYDVLDNNLLADKEHAKKVIAMLRAQKHPARFSGGLQPARLLDGWFLSELANTRFEVAFLAYDLPQHKNTVERAAGLIREIFKHRSESWIRHKFGVYVLCRYLPNDTVEKAEGRCGWVRGLGITPFPMIWRPDMTSNLEDVTYWKRCLWKWLRAAAQNAKPEAEGKLFAKGNPCPA
jgi:hypothetical protein